MNKMLSSLVITMLLLPIILAIPVVNVSAEEQPQYKWTIMVYLDADNNLEAAGISDFNEMEMAGSTDDVAIIVLMDRIEGYDASNGNWTEARIYKVLFDPDTETINSELLLNLGEVNMGDPETAKFFINYTVHNFPAEHYMIVFWDHGDSWRRAGVSPVVKGVCWDETNGLDYLTELELVEIMNYAALLGIHFDIIGFDVCLLQMIEVEYDMYPYADIMVASEEFEPVDGWSYDSFLVPLVLNPDMDAATLAENIVSGYGNYYTNVYPISWATLSAVNLTCIPDIINAINYFAYMLTIEVYLYPEHASIINKIRNETEKFCLGEFLDLHDFASRLSTTQGFSYDLSSPATLLAGLIENATIASFHGSDHPNALGMAIYLPPTVDWYLEERWLYLEQTAFSVDTWWGFFLDYYFKTMTPQKEFRVKVISPSTLVPGEELTVYVLTMFGDKAINPDALVILVTVGNETVSLTPEAVSVGLFKASMPTVPSMLGKSVLVSVDVWYWFFYRKDCSMSQVTSMYQSINELKELVNGSLATIEGNLVIINTALGELKATIDELNMTIIEIKDGIATVQTNLGNIQMGLDSLKAVLGDVANKVISIGNDVAVLKTDVGTIKVKVEELPELLNALGTSIDEVSANVKSVADETSTLKENQNTILLLIEVNIVLTIIALLIAISSLVKKK